MKIPPLTHDLIGKIEQIEIKYTYSRLAGMQAAPGNPLGVAVKRFGNAVAFAIPAWPDFWYAQKVVGITPKDRAYLPEIMEFFHDRSLSPRIEILPGNLDGDLARDLDKVGFIQKGFSTAVYGIPEPDESRLNHAIMMSAPDKTELDFFLDLYEDGFEQSRLPPEYKAIVRGWLLKEIGSLDLCIASIQGQAAGIGILYSHDQIGLLADAAVLPRFRNLGCHSALIQYRIRQAKFRGCKLIASFPEYGSISHFNLEKAGLRVAYSHALWFEKEKR